MKQALTALLGSKKVLTFLITLLALFLTRKVGLDEAQATELAREIVVLAGTLLGAQGLADLGKEKAKAEKAKAEA